MRILCTFLFFIFSYIITYIYVDVCFFHLSLHVLFLSIFIHMFLCVCNLYFCFTLRCLDKFCLKCFKKTGCENLPCHELFSYKVFQEFVLGLDFIVFNKWLQA